ncbi:unnamed protein product [Prunus armeniaca]|uniref:Uncharacterized protein n=1 Tax=Prunus armeniaca TaxID=36596 RepID=A0A6J5UMJ8_PRUAR|nr:unnamed protein product [Prunus armeniaca]
MARKLMKRSRIPPAFIKNFNGGSLRKCSLRGPSGKEVGNFLVFRYDGESKFKVTIYDRSACEKDVEVAKRGIRSSVSIESKGNQVRVKEEIIDLETENYNEDCENKTSIANRRNRNAMSGKKPTTDYVEETSSECISLKSDNRCFMETMKRHYRYCLMIPKKVAIAEGLKSARNVGENAVKRTRFQLGTLVFEFFKQSAIQVRIFGAVNGKRCPVVLDAPVVKIKAS